MWRRDRRRSDAFQGLLRFHGGAGDEQRHVLARVVGGDVGRIAAVVGGDEKEVVCAHGIEKGRQLAVERLEGARVSLHVVAVPVFRVEIDEVREDEIRVGLPHQVDGLAHAVGIRFRADLRVDTDTVEDVADLPEADYFPA